MKTKKVLFSFIIFSIFLAITQNVLAYDVPCYKTAIGSPFTYFELEDIYNQKWISTYLRGKPIILLTAHRYQRYELLKWAESFREEYMKTGKAYVLWIVNMRKCSWNTSQATVYNQWRWFNAPVPVLLDWEGIIGKSLRINYNVPNIILIDSYGRLVMHEMHTYNPSVYKAVSNKISPYCKNVKLKKGSKGDSF